MACLKRRSRVRNEQWACYAADVRFSDPVFTDLQGAEVSDMWRMLCSRAEDFSLTFDSVHADDHAGSARWVATYRFSATGRQVVNHIQARFVFRDGSIIEHRDHFDLWRLGTPGVGWQRAAAGLGATGSGCHSSAGGTRPGAIPRFTLRQMKERSGRLVSLSLQ